MDDKLQAQLDRIEQLLNTILLLVKKPEDESNPEYKLYKCNQIECYESKSGNKTWRLIADDGQIIYLRQSHKEMLENSGGYWSVVDKLEIGQVADCNAMIGTVPDGDFKKPVIIKYMVVGVPMQGDGLPF